MSTTLQHTPGPWRVGSTCGAVVSDHPIPEINGADAVEFYGGHMVAESIAPRNRPLIAAAPALLDALAQWQNAERTEDEEELRNARTSRDAILAWLMEGESHE